MWNDFDNNGARATKKVKGWYSKVNKLCNHAQTIFSVNPIYKWGKDYATISSFNETCQTEIKKKH